jgi:hypothetical protein
MAKHRAKAQINPSDKEYRHFAELFVDMILDTLTVRG